MKKARLLVFALVLAAFALGPFSNRQAIAMPICTLTTCTQARAQCAQDCQNQSCKLGSFTCDSADPCGYDCTCNHCLA